MTTSTYATDSRPAFTGFMEYPCAATGSLEGYAFGPSSTFINSAVFLEMNREQLMRSALAEYINRRLAQMGDKLLLSYVRKMALKAPLFKGISLDVVNTVVVFVTFWVMLTNPEKTGIDLTEDQSVVFTVMYPNAEDVYLELFFEAGQTEPVQHNLAIYKQGEPLLTFGGAFRQTLVKFLEHYGQQIEIPV